MEEEIKPHEWINAKEAMNPPIKKREPTIDQPLSKAVGKKVVMGTPQYSEAVKLINKWNKQARDTDSADDYNLKNDPHNWKPIDHLSNPNKVKDLKRIFQ